jgi:rRNA processing protein Gar1
LARLIRAGELGTRDLPFPRLSAYGFWSFALGGTFFCGSLFFNVGILAELPDESALAGIMGHEIVHSWIGNRKASLLDINATVYLAQQNRVPHLVVIFGTVPKLFFYADYTPRVDLRMDLDYVNKYYEPANASALKMRGNPNFTWNWSHGSYLRGLMSPVCTSLMGELTDANIDICENYLKEFVGRWHGWLDEADRNPLPESERAAQQRYDFYVREQGYRTDPMNVLAQRAFGQAEFEKMLDLRCGMQQMAEARRGG